MINSKGKKLIYVPEDIVERIGSASRKEGMSVGKFVEDALSTSIKAYDMGYAPKDVAGILEVLQTQKSLGEAIIPKTIFAELAKMPVNGKREQLLEEWYECGRWHGRYLKETFDDPISAFKLFLELMRWDLTEVEIKREEDGIKLRCISVSLTLEETVMLSKFIEGTMHGMDHRTKKSDVIAGMIILEFTEPTIPGPAARTRDRSLSSA